MKQRVASILAAFACLMAAHPALAASVPAGARVGIDRTIDLEAFQRIVTRSYHVTFRRIVAADIDRDGDLDVVASTDGGFVVWLNDGNGHLTSQSPTRASTLDGSPMATTWSDGDRRREESIQNDLPSPRLAGVYAHAPPQAAVEYRVPSATWLRLESAFGCRVPRAPPV